jgi:hypothetical protein
MRLLPRSIGSSGRGARREEPCEAAIANDRATEPAAHRRVTWVIVPRYPLTEFLFEHMHELEDVRIIEYPLRPRRWFNSLLRGLEVYALSWMKRSLFLDRNCTEQLARIRPEDAVLFFAIENRKDLQIIRKFVRSPHQHVWLWNPVRTYRGDGLSRLWYLHWLRRSGMQSYTFNPPDARDGHTRLLKQVYRQVAPAGPSDREADAPLFDVYFLGIDKGRLPALRRLQGEIEGAGLTTHFHVVPDKRRRYADEDQAWLSPRWLSYEDNLRNVRRSRAVLELLQSEGCGPTIRSLEAAFLGKKLITDNEALVDSDLYHPSRIFILGRDPMAKLKQFLEEPLQPLDPGVLREHDIVHWIRKFGNESGRETELSAAWPPGVTAPSRRPRSFP